ncbi:MAG: acyl carrier protein [Firmicutes bacterium]|nr:acyl carrier protein [Bacillota bacterium]
MVLEKVQDIVADVLSVDPDDITMDAELSSELEADSLDVIDIVTQIENEFEISIPNEDLMEMRKVGDLVNYVEEHASL